jgi:hypothetical protein
VLLAQPGFNVIATANIRDRGMHEMSSALKRQFNFETVDPIRDPVAGQTDGGYASDPHANIDCQYVSPAVRAAGVAYNGRLRPLDAAVRCMTSRLWLAGAAYRDAAGVPSSSPAPPGV